MASRIILIRHGTTEGNAKHWFYGALDVNLLSQGVQTIKKYKKQGIYPEVPPWASFHTTGLKRTAQTLELIYGDRKYDEIPELQEIHFGEAEGKTFEELKAFPEFEAWANDVDGDAKFPGAESANEFRARVKRGTQILLDKHALNEWSHRHGGRDSVDVMVCHGGVISAIMDDFFPEVAGTMWDWIPEPGCGYVVEFANGKPYMYTRIGTIKRLSFNVDGFAGCASGQAIQPAQTVQSEQPVQSVQSDRSARLRFNELARQCVKRRYALFDYTIGVFDENLFRRSLAYRFDRDAYKISAVVKPRAGESKEELRKRIAWSLCKSKFRYFDYIFISVDDGTTATVDESQLCDVLDALKSQGLARQGGVAWRGTPEGLELFLAKHINVDFVKFPVNYLDEYADGGLSTRLCDAARKYYKPGLLTAPLKDGLLADPGDEALEALHSLDDELLERPEDLDRWQKLREARGVRSGARSRKSGVRSRESGVLRPVNAPVSWAFRYAMGARFAISVVCGVSSAAHAVEDMDAADAFMPLTKVELKVLEEAAGKIAARDRIRK